MRAAGGTEYDLMTEAQKLDAEIAENEAILDSTVYCVFNGAEHYHVGMVCRNQSNGRALSIREALAEGLTPCPNCDPPEATL